MSDHPDTQIGGRDKNVPWWSDELQELSPSTKELLMSYSGISSDQVLPHIYKVVGSAILVDMNSR